MTSRPPSAAHRRPSRIGWFAAHGRVLAGAVLAVTGLGCALALSPSFLVESAPVSVSPDRPAPSTVGPTVEPAVVPAVVPAVEPAVVRAARLAALPAALPAAEVLRDWDRRRAAAYARGSVRALRSLYVPGSRAGTADVAMLREYRAHGLRVTGMRMQLLRVEVLGRTTHRWVLRVTDRLHGAVAVGETVSAVLPRDRASTRTITFRRSERDGRWRVAAVR